MTAENRTSTGLTKTLIAIAIIGALNWGLIGFFNFNLVGAIFGGGARMDTNAASRIVYAIVGLCGLFAAFMLPALRGKTTARPTMGDRPMIHAR
ncbi:MAG: DUF378 domain-containing protein [Deltaproteobacteria bacterium]|nr:DUF378 domain-containing protein [Deltaproteobacteria bacterium]